MRKDITGMMHALILDANFPKDAAGAPYHLQTTNVGDVSRAASLAKLLDSIDEEVVSTRGFTTINGKFKGVSVSIIAIGMGYPMMDMMVREVREVAKGPLKIIRFGSCGAISDLLPVGSIAIADSACFVTRNPDYFHSDSKDPYNISVSVNSSLDLTNKLFNQIKSDIPNETVVQGLNATCDSFYSSQGRIDPNFDDHNQDMIEKIKEKYPSAISLEMETFQLYSLSKIAKVPLQVSACTMVYASRVSDDFIRPNKVDSLVRCKKLNVGGGSREMHFECSYSIVFFKNRFEFR